LNQENLEFSEVGYMINEITTKEESLESTQLSFYSFFTKYTLMDEYGFSSGVFRRLFRKILPRVPEVDSVEYILCTKDGSVPYLLSLLEFENILDGQIFEELDLSIKALCSKVIAFGIDSDVKAKYDFLKLDSKAFESLLSRVNGLAECKRKEMVELISSLDEIELLTNELRKNKHKIGTNFHLTLTTRKTLEYIHRIKELLELRINIRSKNHWEKIFLDYLEYGKGKDSVRRYLNRHSDLVALEIVEHTSNKGGKYIAESRRDYWKFFGRSLLGGGIISLFAFLKLFIDSFELTQYQNAFYYSINYAVCFIVVKELGGIIATKQPAMTASTIAKNIDAQDDLKIDSINSIAILIRKVFRSQFISIIGNFIMALLLAGIIMYSFQLFSFENLTEVIRPEVLMKKVIPTTKLVSFAAIAGLYLALSGLISGCVDNKVVASKIGHRIKHSKLFFKSKGLAYFAEKKLGALVGNICLGFFLGSTFLLSNILPLDLDIRHIAFSSANVGYSVVNYDFNLDYIILALLGALLIGLVNFICSFSLTLYLALKSRGANFKVVPKIILAVIKDFFKNPLRYFFFMSDNLTSKQEK